MHHGSALSGAIGWLLCMAAACVVPAFKQMFAETGVWLYPCTELVIGVPGWAWWVLSLLSLLLLTFKDRWLSRSTRGTANGLFLALVAAAGLFVVGSLFAPVFRFGTERL